jgi:hypothetical protein
VAKDSRTRALDTSTLSDCPLQLSATVLVKAADERGTGERSRRGQRRRGEEQQGAPGHGGEEDEASVLHLRTRAAEVSRPQTCIATISATRGGGARLEHPNGAHDRRTISLPPAIGCSRDHLSPNTGRVSWCVSPSRSRSREVYMFYTCPMANGILERAPKMAACTRDEKITSRTSPADPVTPAHSD